MRRELVTKEELMSQLREQGVELDPGRKDPHEWRRTDACQNGRHLGPPWARSRHSDRVLEHPLSSPNPTEASRPLCVTDIHVAPDS